MENFNSQVSDSIPANGVLEFNVVKKAVACIAQKMNVKGQLGVKGNSTPESKLEYDQIFDGKEKEDMKNELMKMVNEFHQLGECCYPGAQLIPDKFTVGRDKCISHLEKRQDPTSIEDTELVDHIKFLGQFNKKSLEKLLEEIRKAYPQVNYDI